MWEVYDSLLSGMPTDEVVRSAQVAEVWTSVTADCGTGIAMTPQQKYQHTSFQGHIAGMNLAELARYSKSWNIFEATLGVAAFNAWYNHVDRLPNDPGLLIRNQRDGGGFRVFDDMVRGKKVTMIGHIPGFREFSDICDFSILERVPMDGDYPDPACEYILPEQDIVFITATTLANKTMERLLTLTKNCFTVIWGPSTPLTDRLLDAGADALMGTAVVAPEQLITLIGEGGHSRQFGTTVQSVLWFRDPNMLNKLI